MTAKSFKTPRSVIGRRKLKDRQNIKQKKKDLQNTTQKIKHKNTNPTKMCAHDWKEFYY